MSDARRCTHGLDPRSCALCEPASTEALEQERDTWQMRAEEAEEVLDCVRADRDVCVMGRNEARDRAKELEQENAELRRERDEAREKTAEQERGRLLHEALHTSWRYKCLDARARAEAMAEYGRREEQKALAALADIDEANARAATYANAIGRIESVLGIMGAQPLPTTIAAVERLTAELADARNDAVRSEERATDNGAEKRIALVALLRLVVAIDREGYEEGESEAEARDHACDVLANNGLDRTNNRSAVRAALKGDKP